MNILPCKICAVKPLFLQSRQSKLYHVEDLRLIGKSSFHLVEDWKLVNNYYYYLITMYKSSIFYINIISFSSRILCLQNSINSFMMSSSQEECSYSDTHFFLSFFCSFIRNQGKGPVA